MEDEFEPIFLAKSARVYKFYLGLFFYSLSW